MRRAEFRRRPYLTESSLTATLTPSFMPDPTQQSARFLDLSSRIVASTTVVASPSAAAETIIGSVALPSGLTISSGVVVFGWAAYTVGTSGTAVQLKIRQTNVSGTTIAATGALTGSQHGAGILSSDDVGGFDASPGDAQIYKLTMQVTAGAATSTVSAIQLVAIAV